MQRIHKIGMFILIAASLSLMMLSTHGYTFAVNRHDKAKTTIIENIGKEVEGKYDNIKVVKIRKSGVADYVTVYNTTKSGTTPPVPSPIPPPEPLPNTTSGNVFTACFVGDVEGTKVRDAMKTNSCDFITILGDLGYDSSLSWFKSAYVTPLSTTTNVFKCIIGNHDAAEDGSATIYKEALSLCKNVWWYKKAGSTVFIGANTNGNLDSQLSWLKTQLNSTTMKNVKNVFILTHKPCYTTPSSHHAVEPKVKAFCDSLKQSLPTNVKVYYVGAHNHVQAISTDETKFLSGAGGRSHYECGTNTQWDFCNNTKYGFLQFTINKDTSEITKQTFIN